MNIKWEQYGNRHVAIDGDRIIGMVGKMGAEEGAPCEMFQVQFMDNTFSTLEAAMKELELDAKQISTPPVSFADQMVGILKNAVKVLDDAKVKEVA